MGRQRERSALASHMVSVRMTPDMVDWIDTHRGRTSRGKFIRNLVRQEAARVQATKK